MAFKVTKNMKDVEKPDGREEASVDATASSGREPILKLRRSQVEAFNELRRCRYGLLNAPTGWGKSLELAGLVADDLWDHSRKAIITLPQRIVSKGFIKRALLELPSKRQVRWEVDRDLCAKAERKVERLKEFMLAPAEGPMANRIILTTHVTFANAYKDIPEDRRGSAFRNTTLVIDEAHHIQASDEGFNQLGAAIDGLLNLDEGTLRMLLATAYFFRGDRLPILHDNHLEKFVRYHVPFDEYRRTLKHISSYSYDFIAYKGTIWHDLEALLRESQEPTIVFCPPEGHRLHLGKEKSDLVTRVISTIRRHSPEVEVWEPGKRLRKRRVIMNLADQADRSEKISFIMEHGEQVAAVLAVGMFKEGADWVQASRVIDLVPTGSDQDRNQRFGRLIRDFEDKSHVSYFSFFPFDVDGPMEQHRRQFSRLFAHFHASLVLENALRPVKIPGTQKVEGRRAGPGRADMDLIGQFDFQTQRDIIGGSYEAIIQIAEEKDGQGESVRPEEARDAILGVLDEFGITEDREPLAKQIMLLMRRRNDVHLPTADLIRAGFDKVWSSDCLAGVILFSGGLGGPATLREIRQAIEGVFEARWQEMFDEIASLPEPPGSLSVAYYWCTHNKVLRTQGRLSAEKIRRLERIGWWSWQDGFESRWHRRYREIAALPACPKARTEEYSWVRQQRRLRKVERLPEDRIKLCNQIAWWTWTDYESLWERRYHQIRSLVDPPKPRTEEYDWVKYQRRRKAEGKMPADRARSLEEISAHEG